MAPPSSPLAPCPPTADRKAGPRVPRVGELTLTPIGYNTHLGQFTSPGPVTVHGRSGPSSHLGYRGVGEGEMPSSLPGPSSPLMGGRTGPEVMRVGLTGPAPNSLQHSEQALNLTGAAK